MKTTLVFNARNIFFGSGGTSKWSSEVLSALEQTAIVDVRVVSPGHRRLGSGVGGYFWEQLILPLKVRKNEILVSPSNLGPILVKNQALVVHDLLPMTNPDDFSRSYSRVLRLIYTLMLHRVKFIFTVSEQVRSSIENIYPKTRDRVVVIGGGVIPNDDLDNLDGISEIKFCLIVGAHIKRKNLVFLESFWEEIFSSTGCYLYSVARSAPDKALNIDATASKTLPKWLIPRLDVSDDLLNRYYMKARFVLQPSLGEGFGLPLLEGMNNGTPFISSDVGVSSQLCVGSSRVLPLEVEAWKSYLLTNLRGDKTYSESKAQRHEALNHSWEIVVEKLLRGLPEFNGLGNTK
jgi:glycosyltransferase involved in cell wall biosynthesis